MYVYKKITRSIVFLSESVRCEEPLEKVTFLRWVCPRKIEIWKIQKHSLCVSTVIDADRALGQVSFLKFFEVFPLSTSVDSSTDFSQIQCLFCGVEPRWKANCQRQWGRNHQDMGLAIWRLPVDADWPLMGVRFFLFEHDREISGKILLVLWVLVRLATRTGGFTGQIYDQKW